MTHPPRRTMLTTAAAATAAALTGCAGIKFTPWGQPTPTGQDNAPYPADLDHLNDILTLGKTTLPEGATNITVEPALKTAEASPGAWGYVIAYPAQPQPIRDYVDKYIINAGRFLDDFSDSGPVPYIKDVDLNSIEHPWVAGFRSGEFIAERPLGRCWLIITGGFR